MNSTLYKYYLIIVSLLIVFYYKSHIHNNMRILCELNYKSIIITRQCRVQEQSIGYTGILSKAQTLNNVLLSDNGSMKNCASIKKSVRSEL